MRQAFPGEMEEWFQTYDAILTTGEPIRFERRLATLGRVLELYVFRVDDGTASRVAVIFKDITARKADEAGRARLAAIVASSEDAIVSTDLEGIIANWNDAAERLFGYATEEAVGQPVTMLIPHDRADDPNVLGGIRAGEMADHFETVRRRKDGSLVDVSLTVSPILDGRGQVVGASKIARDITERKKAAEALLAADRHKTEFLAMLAHELRNPLAPILVATDILRRALGGDVVDGATLTVDSVAVRPGLSKSGGQALDVLRRQAGHMVRLVDDLLVAGRISQGHIRLRRERIDLASALYHTVEAARPLCQSLTHELTVTLPADPLYLSADPTRLAQIVGNDARHDLDGVARRHRRVEQPRARRGKRVHRAVAAVAGGERAWGSTGDTGCDGRPAPYSDRR